MTDQPDTRAVLPFDPTALLAQMGIGTEASAVLAKYQAGDIDSLARAAVKRSEAEKTAAAAGQKPVMHLWDKAPRTRWLAIEGAGVAARRVPFFARRKIHGRRHYVTHPKTWAAMSAKEQGMFEMREAKE